MQRSNFIYFTQVPFPVKSDEWALNRLQENSSELFATPGKQGTLGPFSQDGASIDHFCAAFPTRH